jgi:hypothetical protein
MCKQTRAGNSNVLCLGRDTSSAREASEIACRLEPPIGSAIAPNRFALRPHLYV